MPFLKANLPIHPVVNYGVNTLRHQMIRRIANAVSTLEGLSLLLSVLFGVGCLAFVGVNWGIHFVSLGQYLAAGAIVLVSVVIALAAMARIPAAQILLFGSAVVIATAFSLGASNLVMP